jgi:hypothetical protein
LINNRQGGRRRGRGGQGGGGGRNLGGQPGNRQDNRQRGNAAQLLEKYKSMARDAQLAGDRVQTEYYLQFADHYFRVLGESRSRFEEQNPRRQRDDEDDDGDDGDEQYGDADGSSEDRGEDRQERSERQERPDRQERGDRNERPERQERSERFTPRKPARRDNEERAARDESTQAPMNGGETIPFDVLPPAIGRDSGASDEPAREDAPKPRRRPRAARPAADEDEVAPAA